jgi:indole-3-glycerol phosphate synthase
MADTLARIVAEKREEVARRRRERPIGEIERAAKSASSPRGFAAALERALAARRYGLIAEIKKASPSKGLIRAEYDPPALARAYAAGGATCLSVLTDEPWFQGCDADLTAARAAVALPVLRKDFMIDPYQIAESRALGADCVLLILAALSEAQARELEGAAIDHRMDVLLEVHDGAELDRALKLTSRIVGINNRNLKSLEVDLRTTEELAAKVPDDRLLIAESGLFTPADLARMARVGARCFLIGESLMRQPDVAEATRALLAPAPVPATA